LDFPTGSARFASRMRHRARFAITISNAGFARRHARE